MYLLLLLLISFYQDRLFLRLLLESSSGSRPCGELIVIIIIILCVLMRLTWPEAIELRTGCASSSTELSYSVPLFVTYSTVIPFRQSLKQETSLTIRLTESFRANGMCVCVLMRMNN